MSKANNKIAGKKRVAVDSNNSASSVSVHVSVNNASNNQNNTNKKPKSNGAVAPAPRTGYRAPIAGRNIDALFEEDESKFPQPNWTQKTKNLLPKRWTKYSIEKLKMSKKSDKKGKVSKFCTLPEVAKLICDNDITWKKLLFSLTENDSLTGIKRPQLISFIYTVAKKEKWGTHSLDFDDEEDSEVELESDSSDFWESDDETEFATNSNNNPKKSNKIFILDSGVNFNILREIISRRIGDEKVRMLEFVLQTLRQKGKIGSWEQIQQATRLSSKAINQLQKEFTIRK